MIQESGMTVLMATNYMDVITDKEEEREGTEALA